MDNSRVCRFEELPFEILLDICQYLSSKEIYMSFSRLNIQLDFIFKSLRNLILVTTSHYDPVFCFFHSFDTVKIYFNRTGSSSLCQFDLSKFVGIRSLDICRPISTNIYLEPIEQLEKFICPDLCPYLQFLQLPYCSQKLIDWIFSGAFPQLKICHIYENSYQRIVLLPPITNILKTLRQLTIKHQNGNEFEKILLRCPNLHYLDFACYNSLSSFVHVNSSYLSLKRLRLSRVKHFLFHNDQFDILLSLFPNLTYFDFTADQCYLSNESINFVRIARCLRHRLPQLKVLELRIYVLKHNHSSYSRIMFKRIAKMHPLFKCFGRTGGLVHIASFDFTPMYHYDRRYLRSSS